MNSPIAEIRRLRPNWEGLHSYNRVWDDCAQSTLDAGLDDFKVHLRMSNGVRGFNTAQQIIGFHALKQMALAHPINFGRAQLDAITGIMQGDGVNVWEFLADYNTPFTNTYLDFSSEAGQPACIPAFDNDEMFFPMFASLVWAGESEFGIIPFGTSVIDKPNAPLLVRDTHIPAPPRAPRGLFYFDHADHHTDLIVDEPTVGLFDTEGSGSKQMGPEIRVTFPIRSLPEYVSPADPRFAQAPRGATVSVGYTADLTPALAALDETAGTLPLPFKALFEADSHAGSLIVTDALAVARMGFAVADSCYFLDAHNVTLAEAQVSRQVRRAAQRSGAHIAQVVRIAATQVRRRTTPKGGTANFSHRFERRGYTRHVTKGSHAKADLVKPCYRRDPKTGEPTCPEGCRREWVPPTVVGPEHLPFVPKARMVPGPNIETEVKT